jgi:MFS transporter, DHA1 family, multidrug resistance protein
MIKRPRNFYLILILGTLTALCPFSIDMYLPSFPKIADALGVPVARLSLSLSSFFIGLAIGQLFYGPLLDRFGRKPPLYAGLAVYILATIGCLASRSVEMLVFLRLIEAIGGCAASVAAMAMVRDFFTGKESAKVFSLLVLILGTSPLLAPTVGGYLSAAFGWQSIFVLLAVIAGAILMVSIFFLPEGHPADLSHSLRPLKVLKSYAGVLRQPQFLTYSISGAFAFSGLFVYLAASPMIYLGLFHVSTKLYGVFFALIAAGFIGCSQFNFLLLRRYSNEQIVWASMIGFLLVTSVFFAVALRGNFSLIGTTVMFFLILASVGIANPNASSLALAPFTRNAGTAAAMMGFLQMSVGACTSSGVGLLKSVNLFPIAVLFVSSAVLALLTLIIGQKKIPSRVSDT